MSGTIRAARAGDAAALGAILSDWIDATPWMPRLHTRVQDRAFVAGLIANAEVAVADEGGAAAGFLCREGHEITALYLAAAARGQGLGAALLDRAKASARRLELWVFQANTGAIRFYRRAGFVESARTTGDNAENLPDIRMTWSAR